MESKHGMDTFLAREVQFVDRLAIGHPENSIKSDLQTADQLQAFGGKLREHTTELTHPQTADCMDERTTVRLGDGTTDPEILKHRITNQLPGGLVLAATKAAVAADVAMLRDAKSFQDAYLLMYDFLTKLGEEDGGHAHCGASKFVEASVEQPVAREIAIPTLGAIMLIDDSRKAAFDKNAETKLRHLDNGLYNGWSPAWHEEFLQQHAPQNFSHLTEVHNADGVYLLTQEGAGFAKNAFTEDTSQECFGVTVPKMIELSAKIGGNAEEQTRLLVAFGTDLLDVSDKLIAEGLPAFADAA
jgi:hypothetical protein